MEVIQIEELGKIEDQGVGIGGETNSDAKLGAGGRTQVEPSGSWANQDRRHSFTSPSVRPYNRNGKHYGGPP